MKLVNFKVGEEVRLGIKTKEGIIDVQEASIARSLKAPATIMEVIAGGDKSLSQLTQLLKQAVPTISEETIVYAPSITNPEKILCIGMNYMSHRDECTIPTPASPIIFSKFNNALAAHQQLIALPASAENFDYEAELVIVIGKEAYHVSPEEALSHVFGYTVGNDISARDLQFRTGQWLLGKTCDHFAPIGPYVVTADEVDPRSLGIKCTVNGELRQDGNTKEMIFDCATIISYISQHMTLKAGDIIFSGTPGGVVLGYPIDEQEWLKPGDKIEVSIEGIGTLCNVLK